MRFIKPESRHLVVAYGIALFTIAMMSVVPRMIIAADAPATSQAEPTLGSGRFVSFKDGILTLQGKDQILVWSKLLENPKAIQFDHEAGTFKAVEDTAAALNQVKPGTWVQVAANKGSAAIRIDAKTGHITGTFVSFKNDRLLIAGKDLSPAFIKGYGNVVHLNKLFEDVPVYESIDGGEYQLIGTANKVLGNVKEGTILTVHGQDDYLNVILIQIGVPKKQ